MASLIERRAHRERRARPARSTRLGSILVAMGTAVVGGSQLTGCHSDLGNSYVHLSACEANDSAGLMACVDRAHYTDDLEFVTGIRPPGSEHWQDVRQLCATRFEQLGFDVEIEEYTPGRFNVIGTLPGTDKANEVVLLSAHYDHLPACAGADDNATGVAGVLEAARVLSNHSYSRTLAVACWDEEELGLIGSTAWADRASSRASKVAISYVFEMIGFKSDAPNSQQVPDGFDIVFPDEVAELASNDNRGDFILLVGDDLAADPLSALGRTGELAQVPTITLTLSATEKESAIFSSLRRSDHAAFWLNDYPAVMITDTANFRNLNYHCIGGPDTIDRLDHGFATQVIQMTVGAVAQSLSLR